MAVERNGVDVTVIVLSLFIINRAVFISDFRKSTKYIAMEIS